MINSCLIQKLHVLNRWISSEIVK